MSSHANNSVAIFGWQIYVLVEPHVNRPGMRICKPVGIGLRKQILFEGPNVRIHCWLNLLHNYWVHMLGSQVGCTSIKY